MIDGARPRHGMIDWVALDELWRQANAHPAFVADRAIERMEQPLPAARARRLE